MAERSSDRSPESSPDGSSEGDPKPCARLRRTADEPARRDLRHERGAAAERAAREHLERHGLRTLLANFRTRAGELDLVMREAGVLVVVEVRCRSGTRFGGALGSVVGHKQRRIVAAAGLLLRCRPEFARLPMRFDVVAVQPRAPAEWTCDWVRDAFRA